MDDKISVSSSSDEESDLFQQPKKRVKTVFPKDYNLTRDEYEKSLRYVFNYLLARDFFIKKMDGKELLQIMRKSGPEFSHTSFLLEGLVGVYALFTTVNPENHKLIGYSLAYQNTYYDTEESNCLGISVEVLEHYKGTSAERALFWFTLQPKCAAFDIDTSESDVNSLYEPLGFEILSNINVKRDLLHLPPIQVEGYEDQDFYIQLQPNNTLSLEMVRLLFPEEDDQEPEGEEDSDEDVLSEMSQSEEEEEEESESESDQEESSSSEESILSDSDSD